MEIISRKEALSRGLKHFLTGRPCKRGHAATRLVSTGACTVCHLEKGRRAYSTNLETERARSAAYRQAHAEKERTRSREKARRLREEHREQWLAIGARYRRANTDRVNERNRAWAAANIEKGRARCAQRRATKQSATPAWVDVSSCREVYSTLPAGHHVDHAVPLKGFWNGQHVVCGLHVHQNLQHLTAAENLAKANKFDPWTYDWWPEGIPRPAIG